MGYSLANERYQERVKAMTAEKDALIKRHRAMNDEHQARMDTFDAKLVALKKEFDSAGMTAKTAEKEQKASKNTKRGRRIPKGKLSMSKNQALALIKEQ